MRLTTLYIDLVFYQGYHISFNGLLQQTQNAALHPKDTVTFLVEWLGCVCVCVWGGGGGGVRRRVSKVCGHQGSSNECPQNVYVFKQK